MRVKKTLDTLREAGRAEEALCEEVYLWVLLHIIVRVEKLLLYPEAF